MILSFFLQSVFSRPWVTDLLSHIVPEAQLGVAVEVTMSVLKATLIILIIQVGMLWGTWLERKFVGRIQDRLGPNRVGIFGLAQPLADMVKILTKEDTTPTAAHRWVYNLGALLIVPPAILGFAVVALDQGLIAADLSVGILYFIAIASTAVVPIFMAGWGSRNKYALLGAMRAVAQIVSYEIPQVLSVVGVLLLAGTLSMQGLAYAQGPLGPDAGAAGFPGVWFIFLQPIAFVIFVLATTAEIERTPFDVPEAESEIIAGYHTEYAGIKFGMFYLALYFATISSAAVAAVLFLGGWQPPLPTELVDWLAVRAGADAGELRATLGSLGWLWMSLKTLMMVLVFMWFRGTLPRLRADQLMAFSWKILVPISLLNLLAAGLVGKLVYTQTPIVVFGAFALTNVILLGVLFGLIDWWNRRDSAQQIRFEQPASGPSMSAGSAR